ncbi:MAG: hypothetical protein E6H07_20010 [Bacteroidetes bacterium]|nr:MAG: hypothetical protein E6H07_20010 [Bacteroidota bacterium]
MKTFFILTIVSAVFFACNNDSKQTATEVSTGDSAKPEPEMKIQIPNMTCYTYVSGKDTIKLKLEKFPNTVTGMLAYLFNEKDKSKGTIDGVMRGDTLVADYTFISEGKSSIRQVVFMVKDSIVTEGYGPQEEKNGRMFFKNVNDVDFSKGIKMQKIQCPVE